MLGSLQSQFAKLLGQSGDPLGLITPDQLKAVLRSIEGKYNTLRDENKRLKATIADLKEGKESLEVRLKQLREDAEREPRTQPESDELVRLRSEYAVVQQAADTLRAELQKAESATDTWRIELHEVRQDSVRLMDELSHATLKLEAARAESDQVRAELASVRSALAQEQHALQDREQELAAFRERGINPFAHAQVVEERDVLRRENEQLAGRVTELGAALEALRRELSEARLSTQVIATTTDNKIQEKLASLENEKLALRLESERLKRELQGTMQSAFRPSPVQAPQAKPTLPKVDPQSAEERRRLLAQLINGQK